MARQLSAVAAALVIVLVVHIDAKIIVPCIAAEADTLCLTPTGNIQDSQCYIVCQRLGCGKPVCGRNNRCTCDSGMGPTLLPEPPAFCNTIASQSLCIPIANKLLQLITGDNATSVCDANCKAALCGSKGICKRVPPGNQVVCSCFQD